MKNLLHHTVLFAMTLLLSSACVAITPPPPMTPDAATDASGGTIPAAEATEPTLTGVTWQWVSLADPMGETDVPMPENYTLSFQEDGTVAIKADCNNAGGTYIIDGGTITIVIGPMTLVACPPDSLSDQFLRDLGFAATYFFEDGQLFIDMMADGGTMAFQPATTDGTSDTTGTAPGLIEATFVCPDGTRIDTVFDNRADTVTFTLLDETITLPRAISGSGARYSDGTTTFWNNGDEALIEINGETVYNGCIAEE